MNSNSKETDSQQTYDVVIIGAGPSGTVAASMLKKAGLSVVILEKQFFPSIMADGIVLNCAHEGVFLDIGTPESFNEANENYKKFEGVMF